MATSNILLDLTDAPPLGKRMEWANTFAGLFTEEFSGLTEPRTDCPTELPELKLFSGENTRTKMYDAQRSKPLNEPMLGQLVYYCTRNHPTLHKQGKCPGLPSSLASSLQILVNSKNVDEILNEVTFNQGQASDWLMEQKKVFLNRYK